MAITKFGGVKLNIGGQEFVVPSLSLRQVQVLQPMLVQYTGQTDAKSIELVIDTAFLAISRNYPDLQRDELLDLIDLRNMAAVMNVVMGASGLVEVAPGEAVALDSTGQK